MRLLFDSIIVFFVIYLCGFFSWRAQEGSGFSGIYTEDLIKNISYHSFYKKYINVEGLVVMSSNNVKDNALVVAANLISNLLSSNEEIKKALVKKNLRVVIIAKNEFTTDVPEYRNLTPKSYWDHRARGLGGTPYIPVCSAAEENILGYVEDVYKGESILIHEFAHTIHELALSELDENFDEELKGLYQAALSRNLWKNTYAATNYKEYWAEGVQSYFDSNSMADPSDGIHNNVRTREQLKMYDPELADLIGRVFLNNPWRWQPIGEHSYLWNSK